MFRIGHYYWSGIFHALQVPTHKEARAFKRTFRTAADLPEMTGPNRTSRRYPIGLLRPPAAPQQAGGGHAWFDELLLPLRDTIAMTSELRGQLRLGLMLQPVHLSSTTRRSYFPIRPQDSLNVQHSLAPLNLLSILETLFS